MNGSTRLLSGDVRTAQGQRTRLAVDDVLGGRPETMTMPLGELGGAEFGIWEITPGTVRDVEADEIFVVLAGAGSVEFTDGTSIDLAPGVAVRLTAGDRTVWRVRETVRKVYFSC